MSQNRWVEKINSSLIILKTKGQIMQIAFWDPGTQNKCILCSLCFTKYTQHNWISTKYTSVHGSVQLQMNVFPDVSHVLSN